MGYLFVKWMFAVFYFKYWETEESQIGSEASKGSLQTHT